MDAKEMLAMSQNVDIDEVMNEYDSVCDTIRELEKRKEAIKTKVKLYMTNNETSLIERDNGSKWVYKEIKGRKTLNKDMVKSNLKDGVELDDCYKEGSAKVDIRYYSASQINAAKLNRGE